jgi:hypothetical protein
VIVGVTVDLLATPPLSPCCTATTTSRLAGMLAGPTLHMILGRNFTGLTM